MTAPVWVSVDVGGTFTDAVAFDVTTRRLRWAKVPTTPGDPSRGVLDAISTLVDDLRNVEHFVHGVTIGTNAIIERRGADVWVVTTLGFRDTLEIQRTERRELYNIKTLKPRPFVPRTRIVEANERLRYDGTVHTAFDESECQRITSWLASAGAESIAVCFLHSFANATHEHTLRDALASALPNAYLCTSSDVLPEIREYERFSTTVLNAYVGPLMRRYLESLTRALNEQGLARTVFLMQSNGGVMSAQRAVRYPVQTVLSGPAGGVAAAIELGRCINTPNLITYDMGGTSSDVCLVEDLRAPLTTEQMVAGHPNRTPQMEIVTVGAGGGSIAWLDDGPILKVGPRSAGADPGPAAYGRGGTEATVTDANLVLGRLGEAKLAASLTLDEAPARAAIEQLASALGGLDTAHLAEGILRITVARMVSAIKEISIAKGFDPRDFALLAYGGAGPMHGVFIAEELEIGHVIIPPSPGNFSAFGCLVSDLQQTRTRTVLLDTRHDDWPSVLQAFDALAEEGRDELVAEGMDATRIHYRRALGMRYVGQSWELDVDIDDSVDSMAAAAAMFHRTHAKRYGHATDQPAQIVTVRVTAIGVVDKPALEPPTVVVGVPIRNRNVQFDGECCETTILARATLDVGSSVLGPALVEEMGSVTVVPPGWQLEVGAVGELHLKKQEPSA